MPAPSSSPSGATSVPPSPSPGSSTGEKDDDLTVKNLTGSGGSAAPQSVSSPASDPAAGSEWGLWGSANGSNPNSTSYNESLRGEGTSTNGSSPNNPSHDDALGSEGSSYGSGNTPMPQAPESIDNAGDTSDETGPGFKVVTKFVVSHTVAMRILSSPPIISKLDICSMYPKSKNKPPRFSHSVIVSRQTPRK